MFLVGLHNYHMWHEDVGKNNYTLIEKIMRV